MRRVLFSLILLFPSSLFADKQPFTLEAAETLEREGKQDQAMAVYEEWLKDHDSDARYPAVVRHCGELKRNPLSAVELYKAHLPRITDHDMARLIKRDIALLYTVLGDNRSALDYFEQAFNDPRTAINDPWLAAVPSLYIACGETDRAYTWIKRVDPALTERALRGELNYALLEIYLIRGDADAAERALAVLARDFSDTAAYPKALLRLCAFYTAGKDRRRAQGYLDILRRDYPGRLETQAAARLLSGRAGDGPALVPNPHDIVGGVSFDDRVVQKDSTPVEQRDRADPSAQAAAAPTTKTAGLRIQVGSYTVRENADYMVRDLVKLGFQAETVRADIKGKIYYRVFVGQDLSSDEAQTILARLNDAGVGGYLYSVE